MLIIQARKLLQLKRPWKETLMSANEAKDFGLIDEVIQNRPDLKINFFSRQFQSINV